MLLDKSRQERLKVNRKAYLDKEKILTRQTGDRIIGALDTSKYYTQKSLHSTHLGLCCCDRFQILFFLAVLNSPFSTYCYRELSKHEIGKPLAQIKIARLERIPIRRIAFVTPMDERARLLDEGKRLYFAALMKTNGAQKMSPKVFDALLEFVDERLEKQHRPDPELVEAHNADPKNADWKIDPDAPFEQADVVHDLLAFLAERMIALNRERQKKMKAFLAWLEAELEIAPDAKGREGIEALTGKTRLKDYLGNYQKDEEALPFDELWEILRKNKRRIGRSLTPTFMQELRTAHENSLAELLPIKETLRLTDGLIDQIVYRLYGLTEEEMDLVESKH